MKPFLKALAIPMVTLAAGVGPLLVWLVTLGASRTGSRLGGRCCMLWSRAVLALLGVKPSVRGKPSGKVFLVAANHLSYLDVWLLGSLYPTAFVAMREIASWPVFGLVARAAGTVFVDRESPRDLVRASEAMMARLERGIPLTLFPEGKATAGETVLPFMPSLFESAAAAGIPCYAASLTYETPGSPEPPSETVCWSGDQTFLPHILNLLKIPRIEATLRFSESPIRSTDRKQLARRLREEVRRGFVPVRQEKVSGTFS